MLIYTTISRNLRKIRAIVKIAAKRMRIDFKGKHYTTTAAVLINKYYYNDDVDFSPTKILLKEIYIYIYIYIHLFYIYIYIYIYIYLLFSMVLLLCTSVLSLLSHTMTTVKILHQYNNEDINSSHRPQYIHEIYVL